MSGYLYLLLMYLFGESESTAVGGQVPSFGSNQSVDLLRKRGFLPAL